MRGLFETAPIILAVTLASVGSVWLALMMHAALR